MIDAYVFRDGANALYFLTNNTEQERRYAFERRQRESGLKKVARETCTARVTGRLEDALAPLIAESHYEFISNENVKAFVKRAA